MDKVIHNIRKVRRQPEHVKRHILHVLTFVCGIILVMLWIYSLGTTLTDQNTQEKIGDDVKPFSALKDNIVGGYNTLSSPTPPTSQ